MTCKECGDEVDELVRATQGKRAVKVCSDCADKLREAAEIGEEAEGAMQSMMEYRGRR